MMDLKKSPTYPKVPKLFQDSNTISKKNKNSQYTKMIEEFVWEIGSTLHPKRTHPTIELQPPRLLAS